MYMYAMVYTNLYACGYDQVHAGMYWYVLLVVCTDIYLPQVVGRAFEAGTAPI